MSDERVWLQHSEHGGHWHAPAEAVADWRDMGWVLADGPPEEHNPVVAENLAWQAEQAEQEAAAPKAAKKSSKTSRGSGPESQE